MKKYLALCVFLIASPLISKQPKIQQPKSYKEITSWKQIYSIPKMSDDCLSTIASALYYLLKQDSTDQDFLKQIISEFYEASRSQHRDCFNGLMKIYEKAMFGTTQKMILVKKYFIIILTKHPSIKMFLLYI